MGLGASVCLEVVLGGEMNFAEGTSERFAAFVDALYMGGEVLSFAEARSANGACVQS